MTRLTPSHVHRSPQAAALTPISWYRWRFGPVAWAAIGWRVRTARVADEAGVWRPVLGRVWVRVNRRPFGRPSPLPPLRER